MFMMSEDSDLSIFVLFVLGVINLVVVFLGGVLVFVVTFETY